jgi:AraC-like DNA-binding protein
MVQSGAAIFSDPEAYQAAVHPAHVEILVTEKGDFRAELARLELPRLWIQRSRENLPRIVHATVTHDRPPIFFLADADQPSIRHKGRELAFGEIVVEGSGSTHHHRSEGPCRWATLSLTRDDLAAAGRALVGRELTAPSVSQYLRPSPGAMLRLLNLHQAAGKFAERPNHIHAQPQLVRAFEHALLHVMVTCLSERAPVQTGWGTLHHGTIIARFEEVLAANYDQPMYLAEICAAIGASERTLRLSCMEHLGMGPVRYLWLRRMHLARRALLLTAPGTRTVTEIAAANGFSELGRFAVEYRALFGEAPSASLRRPAMEMRVSQTSPLRFADSEYA